MRCWTCAPAWACMSLVSWLPALEGVKLHISRGTANDLGWLLEALARCPRLRALDLCMELEERGDHALQQFPEAPALATLRSLTKLALSFREMDSVILERVASALVSLTGLGELTLESRVFGAQAFQPAMVPAALGRLKGLRSLLLDGLHYCVFQAGCLSLPNLLSLQFRGCTFEDAEVVPGVTALHSLTRIEFSGGEGPRFMAPALVELPRLQHVVFATDEWAHDVGHDRLARLPADMGSLRTALRHLSISGQGFTHFPLALTQLAALECLAAEMNEFAVLPAGFTALSCLTTLSLGRIMSQADPLQMRETRPLDVRALGDLSGFPALCALSFDSCEVVMCESVPGAARHAKLTDLSFCLAHPAPGCMPAVLRLSQALRRLERGSVIRGVPGSEWEVERASAALQSTQALSPFQKFLAAMEACEL